MKCIGGREQKHLRMRFGTMSQQSSKSRQRHRPASAVQRQRSRMGLTLVEMLVAMAITLILVYALVVMFESIGSSIAASRSVMELQSKLQGVTHLLHQDLGGLTVEARPWAESASGGGYLQIREGSGRDSTYLGQFQNPANANLAPADTNYFDPTNPQTNTVIGDVDDILQFTSRSTSESFVGQIYAQLQTIGGQLTAIPPGDPSYNPALAPAPWTIESQIAEIIWFTGFDDLNGNGQWNMGEEHRLYRRVLLVRPDIDLSNMPSVVNSNIADDDPAKNIQIPPSITFHHISDVSARPNGAAGMAANSLADLTKRENRFGNSNGAFPNPSLINPWDSVALLSFVLREVDINPAAGPANQTVVSRTGEDIVLTQLMGFDVKVYDPNAPIRVLPTSSEPLVPGDPGYGDATANRIGIGAYVDLGYTTNTALPQGVAASTSYNIPPYTAWIGSAPSSDFSGSPNSKSQLTTATYDTWSLDYERDGIDQDDGGSGLVDEGTDGLDNNTANGVDDVGERETSPPYPVPLRGIQIRLRMYDNSTRQVRQNTVVADFIPE